METVADNISKWEATLSWLNKRVKLAEEEKKKLIEVARSIRNLTNSEADLALLMVSMVDVEDTRQENAASVSAIKGNIGKYAHESSQQTFPEITTEITDTRVLELMAK